jgi:O-antigen ligase
MGLPTGDVLIPLGLAFGFTSVLQSADRYRVPQNILMVIYLGVTLISTWVSAGSEVATYATITYLKRIMVFFMTVWLLDSEKALLRASLLYKLLTLFLAYQAILQALTGASWGGLTPFPGYEETRVRWYGDWDGPNVYALLFVIAIALCLEYIFGQYRILIRICHAFLCTAYLVAMYYTNSRGAVLAVVCSMLFFLYKRKKNFYSMAVAGACIAAVIMFGPSRIGKIHSGESSAHQRTWLWEQGLEMLIENPVLGVGRGQFARQVEDKLVAHNNFVQNFAELGVIGFFLFSCILWLSWRGTYIVGYRSPERNSPVTGLGRGLCSALVGYSACTFFVVMELEVYYWLLGLSVATYLVGKRSCQLEEILLDRKTVATVIALMAGVICAVWVAAVKHIL